MERPYRDAEWHRRRYHDDGATQREIAEANRGRSLSKETRERISTALEGREKTFETRKKMSESTAGEANPNWRGGYNRRYGAKWGPARDAVVERDEVCQHCVEDGTDSRLQVHHIVPVRAFRDADVVSLAKAHDLSNLVLLCCQCHGTTDHGLLGLESGIDDPRE